MSKDDGLPRGAKISNINVMDDISGGKRGKLAVFDLHTKTKGNLQTNRVFVNVANVAPSDVERLKQGKAPIEGPRRYSPTHHIGRADHEQGANMRLFVGQRELHHLAHHNERLLTSTPHPQPDIGAGSIARQQEALAAQTKGWNLGRQSQVDRRHFAQFNSTLRKASAVVIERCNNGGGGGGGGPPRVPQSLGSLPNHMPHPKAGAISLRSLSSLKPFPKAGGVELSRAVRIRAAHGANMPAPHTLMAARGTAHGSQHTAAVVFYSPSQPQRVIAEYVPPVALEPLIAPALNRSACGRVSLSLGIGDDQAVKITTVGGIGEDHGLWSCMFRADVDMGAKGLGKQLYTAALTEDLPSIGYFNPILVEKKLLDTDAQYRSARLSVQSVFMEPTLVINPNLTCTATQRPAEGVLFWRSYPPLQLEFNNAPLKMVPRLVMQTWSGETLYDDDPLGANATAASKQLIRPFAPYLNSFNDERTQGAYLRYMPNLGLAAELAKVVALGMAGSSASGHSGGADFCQTASTVVTPLTLPAADIIVLKHVISAVHSGVMQGADALCAATYAVQQLCRFATHDNDMSHLAEVPGLIKKAAELAAKDVGDIGPRERAQANIALAHVFDSGLPLPIEDFTVLEATCVAAGVSAAEDASSGVLTSKGLATALLLSAVSAASLCGDIELQMRAYEAMRDFLNRATGEPCHAVQSALKKHLPAVLRDARSVDDIGAVLDAMVGKKAVNAGDAAVLLGYCEELRADRELDGAPLANKPASLAAASLISYNAAIGAYEEAEALGGFDLRIEVARCFDKMAEACWVMHICDAETRGEKLLRGRTLSGAHEARELALRVGNRKLQKRSTHIIAGFSTDAFHRRAWLDEAATLWTDGEISVLEHQKTVIASLVKGDGKAPYMQLTEANL